MLLTNVQDLEAEFETIRKRGFAECVEEIERGMCSVADPRYPGLRLEQAQRTGTHTQNSLSRVPHDQVVFVQRESGQGFRRISFSSA